MEGGNRLMLSSVDTLLNFSEDMNIDDSTTILSHLLGQLPVSELISLFEDLTPETQNEWIVRVDNLLAEIEMHDEMAEYIIEIERLRELLRMGFTFLTLLPRVIYLLRAVILYLLNILSYAKITNLTQMKERARQNFNDPAVTCFNRIYSTVFCVAVCTLIFRIQNLIGTTPIEEVTWHDLLYYLSNGNADLKPSPSRREIESYLKSYVLKLCSPSSTDDDDERDRVNPTGILDETTWNDFNTFLFSDPFFMGETTRLGCILC